MMTSKAGKPFCCIKLTDLTAYNMPLIQAKVTKELEPLVQGYGAAWWKSVEVEVEDGRLDIGFNGRRGSPKLSAFEIKRIRKG